MHPTFPLATSQGAPMLSCHGEMPGVLAALKFESNEFK